MTLDSTGDIIIAGNQANTNGDLDYAVLKYTRSGTQLWAKTYSSSLAASDQLLAMTVDSNGNVYVTGTSKTVKYSREGLLQWVAPYAGRALAVDSNEFLHVVGFQTTDFATVKLAPNGTNVWLRTHNRPFGPDTAMAVALGPVGEVYVGGTVTWAYDQFGNYLKFAAVKYDAEGTQLWVSPDQPPTSLYVYGQVEGLSVLGNRVYLAGNFTRGGGTYVTGVFDTERGTNEWFFAVDSSQEGMTSMYVGPSGEVYMTGRLGRIFPNTIFYRTVALNTNGTLRWQTDFGPPSGYHRANGIANALGCTYVTGQASPSFVEGTFTGATFDFLTIKYDNDGHELWQKRYNGPANNRDIAIGIAVTPEGGIFVAGQSANTNGGTDITLLKYIELENIQWLPNGSVLLQFPASPGQSVRFQASTNLITWQDIATVTPSPEGIARYTDTTVPQHPHRFYRLALP